MCYQLLLIEYEIDYPCSLFVVFPAAMFENAQNSSSPNARARGRSQSVVTRLSTYMYYLYTCSYLALVMATKPEQSATIYASTYTVSGDPLPLGESATPSTVLGDPLPLEESATPSTVSGDPLPLEESATPSTLSQDPSPIASKKEKYLTCTVCLDSFKEPKVLPCCHTFCKSCLERIVEKAKVKEKLVCPQCRAEHKVPSNGPEGFLTDFGLLHDVKKLKSPKSEMKESHICGECDSGDTAIAFCTECQSYLCSSCASIHKKLKHFRNHKVTSLECLSEKVCISANEPVIILHCRKHLKEPLKVFCKTCQVLVCCQCIADSHECHKFGPISEDTRTEVQSTLDVLARKARKNLTEFEENLKYIEEVEQLAADRPAILQTAINGTFDSLVAALEVRRSQLLKQADEKCNEDLKEVWAQKDYVETVVTSLSSALAFKERAGRCSHDIELLSLCSQAIDRMKELEACRWERTTVETVDCLQQRFIGGDHTAYPTKVGEIEESVNLSRVSEKTSAIQIEVSLSNLPSSMYINESVELKLKVKAVKSKKNFHINVNPSDIIAQVSVVDSLIPAAEELVLQEELLVKEEDGVCTISFAPTCSGQHRISIYVGSSQLKREFTVQVAYVPVHVPRRFYLAGQWF